MGSDLPSGLEGEVLVILWEGEVSLDWCREDRPGLERKMVSRCEGVASISYKAWNFREGRGTWFGRVTKSFRGYSGLY